MKFMCATWLATNLLACVHSCGKNFMHTACIPCMHVILVSSCVWYRRYSSTLPAACDHGRALLQQLALTTAFEAVQQPDGHAPSSSLTERLV
eukprot:151325-Chlamydomonas_euryale.AAC.4